MVDNCNTNIYCKVQGIKFGDNIIRLFSVVVL